MKIPTILLILSLILTIALFSCGKNGPGNPINGFNWTYEGITYSTTVDTAYNQSPGPYAIIAVYGTSFISYTRRIDIVPTSFAPGVYNFNGGGNSLNYIDEFGNNLFAASGSLNITGNSNNHLSGNFSASVTHPAGGTRAISGNFTNVIIK